jgi:hypothetical protein
MIDTDAVCLSSALLTRDFPQPAAGVLVDVSIVASDRQEIVSRNAEAPFLIVEEKK